MWACICDRCTDEDGAAFETDAGVRDPRGHHVSHVGLCVTGVQMKTAPPPSLMPEWDMEDGGDGDRRLGQYARDHNIVRDPDTDNSCNIGAGCNTGAG